jgi:hypothetical protein
MFYCKKYIAFNVFIFISIFVSAQNPLTINLAPIGRIESSVTELPNQVLITVLNNNATELDVYFKVGLAGTTADGRTISMDNNSSASANVITIPSTGLTLSLTELIEEYQNTTLSDYTIFPTTLLDEIRRTGHLPAGTYNICLAAYDRNDVLVSESILDPNGNYCLGFDIRLYDPPMIQTPIHNSWVAENEDNQIIFTWAQALIDPSISYTLELIRFSSQADANNFIEQGNSQEIFESYDPILVQRDISGFNFSAFAEDVIANLTPGDILAVRVTSVSESTLFVNNGRSDIHVFIYGVPNSVVCNNPSLTSDWAFPSIGDTLPFTDLFPVARFQPSCDNILEMNADINFSRSFNGRAVGSTTVRNYTDNWRSGPGPSNYLRNYVNRHFAGNADYYYPNNSEYEQYLPFLHNESNFIAERGEQVNIFGITNFTIKVLPSNLERTQSLNLNAMNTRGIVIGMPKPILQSPANDAVMNPGNVAFEFSTGLVPGNPLPPFKIFKLDGNRDPIIPRLQVKEKCLLQVATDNTFSQSSIVFCKIKKIQNNPYQNGDSFDENNPAFQPFSSGHDLTPQRQFDQDHFINNVYKDLSISNNFDQEDTLYWRVVWLRYPEPYNMISPCGSGIDIRPEDIYHESSIRRLILRADPLAEASVDETQDCALISPENDETLDTRSDSSACASACVFPAITDNTPAGRLASGTLFKVAGFDAEVKSVSSGGNGRAVIALPFLNNIKVKVNFSGLQLNAARQMISGSIEPEIDNTFPMSDYIGPMGRIFGMDQSTSSALNDALVGGQKLLSLLASGSEVSLPIGIDRNVDGQTIVIGIPNITFRKDTAHMNMVVNLNLPNLEVVGGFISLGAQVCITKGGFGNDVRLYLPQDQIFPMDNGNEFRIKGAGRGSDPRQITSVEWDCNGFKALNLVGAFKFTRDWMLPESDAGQIQPSGNVSARFSVRVTRGTHFLINLDMDRFQVPGAEGWSFLPRNAFIDYSDIENPVGLVSALPSGYRHPAFSSGGMGNTWKGFYMQAIEVRTPESFQSGGRRVTFAARNILIDDTGLSTSIRAENLLEWSGDGDFNGWSASLDTVRLDIAQNNFRAFGLNGKVGLPITEQTQYIQYSAVLCYGTTSITPDSSRSLSAGGDNFNFVINIKPVTDIRIPISMATAVVSSESYIRATIGNRSSIEANICARLSLSSSNLSSGGPTMPASFALPQLVIENLRVNSEVGFDDSEFRYSLTGLGNWGGTTEGRTGGGQSLGEEEIPIWLLPPASQESSLSGFPIGLEYFSISNEGISIEPRITLSQDGTGIGASARILLRIRTDDSFKSFELTGVDLQRISLNVETSSLKIAGYLEFYKEAALSREGVRGGVTLEIDMGTKIGVDINAEFGVYKNGSALAFDTPNWYSYFYVDGLAYLSNGITIFSGLSLFGLGGGFYYHMTPAVSGGGLPNGGGVQAASNSGVAASSLEEGDDPPAFRPMGTGSGVRYENTWNTLFGLKFMVLMGSNDMGKAYNMDVTLAAQFGPGGGLVHFGFRGTFRVMAENGLDINTIGRFDASPIGGFIDIQMSMPANDDAAFHGAFGVRLKFPNSGDPILHGLGTLAANEWHGPADNLLVMAEFHIDPHLWYFNMGNPEPGGRAGVALTLGGQRLFEINKYLMVGMRIPSTMPSPDQAFLDIFEEARSYGVQSLDGDPHSLMEGRPRPTLPGIDLSSSGAPGTGTGGNGFAFGMAMKLNIPDLPVPPFYFSMATVMGFDINVTQDQSGSRRCAGSDEIPGLNNGRWYAMGQVYCGIRGEFGLGVPYIWPDAKISIFKGSAAIILNGGLFGPDWLKGRGRFGYDVCGNRGSCEFALEVGEVCFPTEGNPFSALKLVQDISPAHNSTDVSVYTDVSAAFLVEMNREYELQENISATEPPVMRRFTPYMHSFVVQKDGGEVLYRNTGGESTVGNATTHWKEENRIFNCNLANRLDGTSRYVVTAEARVRENGRDIRNGDTTFYHRLSHNFTTGREPNKFIDGNIDFTYPYLKQQNFLKGESMANKGYIRALNGLNTFLSVGGDVSDYSTSFTARFTSEDNVVIETPAQIIPGTFGVIFDVNQLANDKVYCIQIIRKDVPNNTSGKKLDNGIGNTLGYRPLKNEISKSDIIAKVKGNVVQAAFAKQIKLPAGNVGLYERELYSYYFKTSEYNTMSEKLKANSNWSQEKNAFVTAFGMDGIDLKKNMSESFEWGDIGEFDMRSLLTDNPNTTRVFSKRLKLHVEMDRGELDGVNLNTGRPNTYLKNVVQSLILNPYNTFLMSRNSIQSRADEMLRIAAPTMTGRQFTVPIISNPYYSNYDDFVTINPTSPKYHPLKTHAITSAFSNDPKTSLGRTFNASSTKTGKGTLKDRPTLINYYVHLNGVDHYKQVARAIRNFASTPVFMRNGAAVFNGREQATIYSFMNEDQRSFMQSTISRTRMDINNYTKLKPGRHEMVMKYYFPDVNGNDINGTNFDFGFDYNMVNLSNSTIMNIWR